MVVIKIGFDPYHMKTSLNINGKNIKKDGEGYEKIQQYLKKAIPLQSWIDPISFQEWRGLLIEAIGNSNETEVECHFQGRELDFIDLKESFDRQSKKEFNGRYNISVKYPKPDFIYTDEEILERAEKAYKLICSEDFKQILDDKIFKLGEDSQLVKEYNALEKKYQAAREDEFRIVFSGMYTCGKSTLINAILGKDILPTRDGTCTSKVFKISHDPNVEYAKMSCVDANGKVVVKEQGYTAETLHEAFEHIFPRGKDDELLPSVPETIETVLVSTDMSSLYPEDATYNTSNMKLVIIDTPGTSSGEGNMVDEGKSHCEITKKVVQSSKKEIVVFATNASEDKDDSIQDFLDMVDEAGSQGAYDQRFLFVLNRADQCSLKPGETWEKKLRSIRNYYIGKKRSIQNPRFFPTSALAAFTVRRGLVKTNDYKKIEANYYSYDEDVNGIVAMDGKENYHFDEYCSTSQSIKDSIHTYIDTLSSSKLKPAERRQQEILFHSGVVSLEMAIRDYIAKYAFPLKIQELLNSYDTICKETKQLVSITSKKFDQAVRDLQDAQSKQKAEEEEHTDANKTKASLEQVSTTVNEKKEKVDAIATDFHKNADQQLRDVKGKMAVAIGKANSLAQENPKSETVKSEVQKIVEDAAVQCRTTIDTQFSDSRKKAMALEKEVMDFFREIKSTVDLGDDFRIDLTTDFETLNTGSILEVQNAGHWARNPELDRGFILFRPIKNLFIEKSVWRDDGINTDKLNEVLETIYADFDTQIDKTFNKAKENLSNASDKLKFNMDKLEARIVEYADRLTKMKATIKTIAADVKTKSEYEAKLNRYNALLALVQKYTNFDSILEME